MGYRDDRLTDDERADAALRQLLAGFDEPQTAPPPADLVSRTARRLPVRPPAQAARAAARAALLSVAARAALLLVALLIVGLGATAMLGGDWLALRFGDGSTGLSRTFLTLQLLAKPLWRAGGTLGPLQLLAAIALFGGVVGLWWRLARPAPQLIAEGGP